ncbi:MAG: YCF48-related protein, partial [Ignavibacteriaceae bacterium]|nr:YCF48-related protein [Ignavibacteriaceae bacterium]
MKRIFILFLLIYSVNHAQWLWQNPLPQGNPLGSIYFVDSNTGWTVGTGGTILKTTNGGNSWETQNSGTEEYLLSTFFINANTGWVVGSNGLILKTTNSGDNWFSQSSGTSEA